MPHPKPSRSWPGLVWFGVLVLGSLPNAPLLGQSFVENKGQVLWIAGRTGTHGKDSANAPNNASGKKSW